MIVQVAPKKYGIIELYDAVAQEMGYADPSALKYDCTKICISREMQYDIYAFYLEFVRETNKTASDDDILNDITIMLAMQGPKVNKELNGNEVEVFDGFIVSIA